MKSESLKVDMDKVISDNVAKFEKPDATIAMYSQQYLPIKMKGADDLETFEVVVEGLKIVSSKRIAVEKLRKELKADALKFERAVDAEAKRISKLLEPIEEHLKTQKAVRDDFLAEEKRKEAEKIRLELEEKNRLQAAEIESLRNKLNEAEKEKNEINDLFGTPVVESVESKFGPAFIMHSTPGTNSPGVNAVNPVSDSDKLKELIRYLDSAPYSDCSSSFAQKIMDHVKDSVKELSAYMHNELDKLT